LQRKIANFTSQEEPCYEIKIPIRLGRDEEKNSELISVETE
jgi:hypothetical protein